MGNTHIKINQKGRGKNKTTMKYPKIIYVQVDENAEKGDELYNLLCWPAPEDANDGKIAVYELKKTEKKETKSVIS
jgi:hypothetical protein